MPFFCISCIPLIHCPLFLSLPVRRLFIRMIESLFTSSQTCMLTGMWVFIFSMYHLYNVGGWGGGGGGAAFDPEIFSNLMSCLLTAIYSIVSHWCSPPPSPSTSGSAASRESSPVSSPATAHSSPITTPKRSSLGPLLGQTRGHGVPSTPPVVTIAPTKTSNGLWRADKRQVGHTSASFVVSPSLSPCFPYRCSSFSAHPSSYSMF